MASSTHETTAHSGEAAGLPQMRVETFAGQLFWLAVAFTLLYVTFATVALPRLGRVIEARKTRIQSDLDEAERAKLRSEEAIRSYEQALADARARARKMGDDMRATVQAKIDQTAAAEQQRLQGDVSRAEARIAAMRQSALGQVNEIAADAAAAMIERIGGIKPAASEIEAAVAKALAIKA